ncbi:hypothetical protein NOR51B_1615 [Luminiphilus syltensis NOR5-1B]|uniref:Uncharacterized protein n=1 Tax=Luminiphilus syltensis NOR5-1B TaxID=565045 RepID=B8KTT7_9GAMM|nr:hypothetical protein NOR51B_1615 [Luminiphilus syltensis NOR5-1B]
MNVGNLMVSAPIVMAHVAGYLTTKLPYSLDVPGIRRIV